MQRGEKKRGKQTSKSFFFKGAFSKIKPMISKHCQIGKDGQIPRRGKSWFDHFYERGRGTVTFLFLSFQNLRFFWKSELIFFTSFSEIS